MTHTWQKQNFAWLSSCRYCAYHAQNLPVSKRIHFWGCKIKMLVNVFWRYKIECYLVSSG